MSPVEAIQEMPEKTPTRRSLYKNFKDLYNGAIIKGTRGDDFVLFAFSKKNKRTDFDYSVCKVFGSWDNWRTEYNLYKEETHDCVVLWKVKDMCNIQCGMYEYKVKGPDGWIEPSSNDVKKYTNDYCNNVVFVHIIHEEMDAYMST
jgi:hypothetical protein